MNKLPINQKSKLVYEPRSPRRILILDLAAASWPDTPLGFGSISKNATEEVMIFTFLPNCWWFSLKTCPPPPPFPALQHPHGP